MAIRGLNHLHQYSLVHIRLCSLSAVPSVRWMYSLTHLSINCVLATSYSWSAALCTLMLYVSPAVWSQRPCHSSTCPPYTLLCLNRGKHLSTVFQCIQVDSLMSPLPPGIETDAVHMLEAPEGEGKMLGCTALISCLATLVVLPVICQCCDKSRILSFNKIWKKNKQKKQFCFDTMSKSQKIGKQANRIFFFVDNAAVNMHVIMLQSFL